MRLAGPYFAPTEAELERYFEKGSFVAAVLGCSTPRRCTIPPGALIKTNPGLFLQVREWESIGTVQWHAYYNQMEGSRGN